MSTRWLLFLTELYAAGCMFGALAYARGYRKGMKSDGDDG